MCELMKMGSDITDFSLLVGVSFTFLSFNSRFSFFLLFFFDNLYSPQMVAEQQRKITTTS